MFGLFLFSWFIGKGGPKISCTKTQTLPNLRLRDEIRQQILLAKEIICSVLWMATCCCGLDGRFSHSLLTLETVTVIDLKGLILLPIGNLGGRRTTIGWSNEVWKEIRLMVCSMRIFCLALTYSKYSIDTLFSSEIESKGRHNYPPITS